MSKWCGATLFLFLSVSCTAGMDDAGPMECTFEADDFWQHAVDVEGRWMDTVGELDSECVDIPVVVEVLSDVDDFSVGCRRPEHGLLVGCSWIHPDGTAYVWVLDCQRDFSGTLEHEWAHVLAECQGVEHRDHSQYWWGSVAP